MTSIFSLPPVAAGAAPRRAAPVVGCLVAGFIAAAAMAVAAVVPACAAPQEVRIALLARKQPPPPIYEVDPVPADDGLAGGRLAIRDNTTTGMLTGQTYTFEEVLLDEGDGPVDAARKLVDGGTRILVVNLPADELLAVADALKGTGAVIFNVGATDDRLRGADCRANAFHVAPSRAMLTDALAQFLAAKRWRNIFLVVGPGAADKLYANAWRLSAAKFGLKIVAEKAWDFGPLARARADGPTQAEALVFTRGVDADVVVVADEAGDFGDYVPYHTWDPKLVAGTQGLVAATWHRAQDAWGAAQLQSRFSRSAKRAMRPLDYQVWAALRAVGEAATRSNSADPADIVRFLLSPEFSLAAFKGVPASFRPWDHQLRQPILVAQPMALVSISPQPGFIHQRTPLDTLGVDQPETACRLP
jgi:ABC transporter substrate binding protein (PQQ-dependent alcohol dehydrogenase system)